MKLRDGYTPVIQTYLDDIANTRVHIKRTHIPEINIIMAFYIALKQIIGSVRNWFRRFVYIQALTCRDGNYQK
jgi:hypothetical protein